MHLDVQAIAGLLELFPKPFCLGYCHGNIFVVESFVVEVVMLVPSGCLCIVDVVPVVEFFE